MEASILDFMEKMRVIASLSETLVHGNLSCDPPWIIEFESLISYFGIELHE
jgi:hypothetical protein